MQIITFPICRLCVSHTVSNWLFICITKSSWGHVGLCADWRACGPISRGIKIPSLKGQCLISVMFFFLRIFTLFYYCCLRTVIPQGTHVRKNRGWRGLIGEQKAEKWWTAALFMVLLLLALGRLPADVAYLPSIVIWNPLCARPHLSSLKRTEQSQAELIMHQTPHMISELRLEVTLCSLVTSGSFWSEFPTVLDICFVSCRGPECGTSHEWRFCHVAEHISALTCQETPCLHSIPQSFLD